MGGHRVLAVAPLHPQLSYQDTSANGMLTLFRRTPDPTIQWVRLEALSEIYEGRTCCPRFVPPEQIMRTLREAPPATGLYDRIAETNRAMAERIGVKNVEKLLREISEEAARNYASILLEMD